VPSKEAEEEEEEEEDNHDHDLSQADIMPGSFEPAQRETSLPWTEVVGKKYRHFLMLLHVK